jgi:hypothetical protein
MSQFNELPSLQSLRNDWDRSVVLFLREVCECLVISEDLSPLHLSSSPSPLGHRKHMTAADAVN